MFILPSTTSMSCVFTFWWCLMPSLHCYTHEPCGCYVIIRECDGNLFWNLSSMPPTWLIKLYAHLPSLNSQKKPVITGSMQIQISTFHLKWASVHFCLYFLFVLYFVYFCVFQLSYLCPIASLWCLVFSFYWSHPLPTVAPNVSRTMLLSKRAHKMSNFKNINYWRKALNGRCIQSSTQGFFWSHAVLIDCTMYIDPEGVLK